MVSAQKRVESFFVRRSAMGKPRRLFTREFKVEAIKLVTEQGCSNALGYLSPVAYEQSA